MFKIKITKNESKIFEAVKVKLTDNYTYVITDDVSQFEEGKINIIFDPEHKNQVEEIVRNIALETGVKLYCESLTGYKMIDLSNIDYIEAFDTGVFVICGKERFSIEEKLYSLEERLKPYNFMRISKSVIVNIAKVDYVKPMFNSKLKLIMLNQDALEVNRTYLKEFKDMLKK